MIPNPIKASIRKAIRDHLGGQSSNEEVADTKQSAKAVESDPTNKNIRQQEDKIRKMNRTIFY